ncbi:MAG: ribosomal protein S18-alanine N-acetyltransferase [Clostridiaceae bacterium]
MDFKFSIANMGHIDDICEINDLSFSVPWSRMSVENEIVNENSLYLVILKDDKVIGYAGIWIILDEGHITNIAVHPNYRSIGIASALLEELIEQCRRHAVHSMTLEVRKSNIIAQKLYEKFNFVNEGIRKNYYSDNGEDAIIMWKYDI